MKRISRVLAVALALIMLAAAFSSFAYYWYPSSYNWVPHTKADHATTPNSTVVFGHTEADHDAAYALFLASLSGSMTEEEYIFNYWYNYNQNYNKYYPYYGPYYGPYFYQDGLPYYYLNGQFYPYIYGGTQNLPTKAYFGNMSYGNEYLYHYAVKEISTNNSYYEVTLEGVKDGSRATSCTFFERFFVDLEGKKGVILYPASKEIDINYFVVNAKALERMEKDGYNTLALSDYQGDVRLSVNVSELLKAMKDAKYDKIYLSVQEISQKDEAIAAAVKADLKGNINSSFYSMTAYIQEGSKKVDVSDLLDVTVHADLLADARLNNSRLASYDEEKDGFIRVEGSKGMYYPRTNIFRSTGDLGLGDIVCIAKDITLIAK